MQVKNGHFYSHQYAACDTVLLTLLSLHRALFLCLRIFIEEEEKRRRCKRNRKVHGRARRTDSRAVDPPFRSIRTQFSLFNVTICSMLFFLFSDAGSKYSLNFSMTIQLVPAVASCRQNCEWYCQSCLLYHPLPYHNEKNTNLRLSICAACRLATVCIFQYTQTQRKWRQPSRGQYRTDENKMPCLILLSASAVDHCSRYATYLEQECESSVN